jgi:aspartyl-tRNA(Asn)/glutamyl-tRNA(Gln) amidotransferase subunit A
MAKTSEDAAILFWAIAGHDPKDMTSSARPVPSLEALLGQDPRQFRLGLPKEYFVEGMDQEVRDALLATLANLEGLGVQVEEISLPHTPYATAVYYILATSEASSNLARYDGVKYGFRAKDADSLLELYELTRAAGFGPEVKRRIMLGTYALSAGYYEAYYKKAAQVRRLILEDFTRAFEKVDAIVSPTTPTPPFLLGEKIEDPLTMYLSDIYTNALNLAGLPGMSLPIARTGDGLPVGMQIMAPAFMEERLFCLGSLIEELTNPPIRGVPFDQPIA